MRGVVVATRVETIVDEVADAMSKERVTLHFAETNASAGLATFDGLVRDGIDRTLGADLVLIAHHVTQALVIHEPDENFHLKWLASHTADHRLAAVIVETVGCELLAIRIDDATSEDIVDPTLACTSSIHAVLSLQRLSALVLCVVVRRDLHRQAPSDEGA